MITDQQKWTQSISFKLGDATNTHAIEGTKQMYAWLGVRPQAFAGLLPAREEDGNPVSINARLKVLADAAGDLRTEWSIAGARQYP